MEFITTYGKFLLAALLIIVGIIAILWSRSEKNNVDDPEMQHVGKAFGVVGWILLIIGVTLISRSLFT